MRAKKILIIDDDDRIRDIAAVALSKAGAGVASAADGPEGLRQLESYQPDLVILDIGPCLVG